MGERRVRAVPCRSRMRGDSLGVLAGNSIFGVLDPGYVDRRPLHMSTPVDVVDHGDDLGIRIEAFAVPGKVALERLKRAITHRTPIGPVLTPGFLKSVLGTRVKPAWR